MLAGDIGLPEWLVNIRHEATHYTLPSMDLLRNGVSVALEWLKVPDFHKNTRLPQKRDLSICTKAPAQQTRAHIPKHTHMP